MSHGFEPGRYGRCVLAFAVSLALSAASVPADFIDDVRPLYDVVTCQGTPLAQLDAKTLAAFCTRQNKRYGHFRAGWAVRERKNNPTKSGGGRVAGLVGRHGVGTAEHRRGAAFLTLE